ncbi:hypothetical protein GCM10010964_36600 [Caldovatus sediminis]|uniref:Uncharacterized protein n=1 Tax=Caldovatus sediminis TaxID=2041189 RepID=A0A8J2ZE38_9PROT|nr:hypothetical protein [Caldovatus sediminis]GGG45899.1 hypothetical protein GCM10010964_36600 [Caldovatus sediminis]
MAEDEQEGRDAEAFLLIEGRLLGLVLFPYAMAEVERVPPANDTAPGAAPQEGPQPGEDGPRQPSG